MLIVWKPCAAFESGYTNGCDVLQAWFVMQMKRVRMAPDECLCLRYRKEEREVGKVNAASGGGHLVLS